MNTTLCASCGIGLVRKTRAGQSVNQGRVYKLRTYLVSGKEKPHTVKSVSAPDAMTRSHTETQRDAHRGNRRSSAVVVKVAPLRSIIAELQKGVHILFTFM